jgi:uncharacterized protein YjbI with pentapeptide repeats
MLRCKFTGSDLSGFLLKNNNVDCCDFSGSDVSSSRIQGSNLGNNIFKGCKLNETEFSKSNITGCDFSGVNFTGTEFSGSFLTGCDFSGADFTGMAVKSGGFGKNTIADSVWKRASFADSQIADIVFIGKLKDCCFENCVFTRVTFRNSTLLNTFFKNNKKLKQIRFFDCQADRITCEFLKQGKADLTGIALMTS